MIQNDYQKSQQAFQNEVLKMSKITQEVLNAAVLFWWKLYSCKELLLQAETWFCVAVVAVRMWVFPALLMHQDAEGTWQNQRQLRSVSLIRYLFTSFLSQESECLLLYSEPSMSQTHGGCYFGYPYCGNCLFSVLAVLIKC